MREAANLLIQGVQRLLNHGLVHRTTMLVDDKAGHVDKNSPIVIARMAGSFTLHWRGMEALAR